MQIGSTTCAKQNNNYKILAKHAEEKNSRRTKKLMLAFREQKQIAILDNIKNMRNEKLEREDYLEKNNKDAEFENKKLEYQLEILSRIIVSKKCQHVYFFIDVDSDDNDSSSKDDYEQSSYEE